MPSLYSLQPTWNATIMASNRAYNALALWTDVHDCMSNLHVAYNRRGPLLSWSVRYNCVTFLCHCSELNIRERLLPAHCIKLDKRLADAKRPCDCRVLCIRLKSSLCSCAHSISDMTSFGGRDQGRDSVRPMLWMPTWKKFKKARVNGGSKYNS